MPKEYPRYRTAGMVCATEPITTDACIPSSAELKQLSNIQLTIWWNLKITGSTDPAWNRIETEMQNRNLPI
jgi:hypothetical protein